MTDTQVTFTFADMLRAALDARIDMSGNPAFMRTGQGAHLRIPLRQAWAVQTASDVGGRPSLDAPVDWLSSESDDSPILSRLRMIPTSYTRGRLPSGQALPATSMQGETSTAALPVRVTRLPTGPNDGDLVEFSADATGLVDVVDTDGTTAVHEAEAGDRFLYQASMTRWQKQLVSDPVFGDHPYDLSKVIEAKTSTSVQAVVQSDAHELDELILESHRIAIRDTMLDQLLNGDGVGNNLSGLITASGVGGGTYAMGDSGKSSLFTIGEAAVEDGDGRGPNMSWALGRTLSAGARGTAIDPGGSRLTEERGRLTLSGLPVQRVKSGLDATTGIVADWATVLLPMLDQLLVVVDTITEPGTLRLTSRLPVADPIISHPAAVYILTAGLMPNLGTCSRCTSRLWPSLYRRRTGGVHNSAGHVVYDAPIDTSDPTLGSRVGAFGTGNTSKADAGRPCQAAAGRSRGSVGGPAAGLIPQRRRETIYVHDSKAVHGAGSGFRPWRRLHTPDALGY